MGGERNGETAALEDEIARGGISRAIDAARAVRSGARETAVWFFERYAELSRDSVDFAIEHAQFLHDSGEPTRALEVIAGVPMAATSERIAVLAADAERALGHPKDAIARLDRLIDATRTSSSDVWTRLVDAAMATGESDRVLAVHARWRRLHPRRAARVTEQIATWLDDRGDGARAAELRAVAAIVKGT